ncbi:MAG: hypothetical protein M3068_02865 [Gemmatimonadota bacterium]|nr:hypothetical protein [Gemmatimonadota bacterium]
MRPFALLVLLAALGLTPVLPAQAKPDSAQNNKGDSDSTESESEQKQPTFAFGARAGVFHLSDTYRQRAFGLVLQWRATDWLTLSTNPGYATVDTTIFGGRTRSRSGLTDLPVGVTLSHDFEAQLHPSLSLGAEVTLATGDTVSGVGSGETSVGMTMGLGLAPATGLNLYFGASRPVSGTASASALSAGGTTSLDGEVSYDIWRRLTGSASFSADVGTPDNAAGCGSTGVPSCEIASRSVAGGVALGVAGPWTVTLDGSHSVSALTPNWTLSLGVGTAFAGVSPISGLHRRLGFLQRALRCSGGRRSRRGTTTSSCSAAGA